jgi:hypothetical protein
MMGSWNSAHGAFAVKDYYKNMIVMCQRSMYVGIILIFHIMIWSLLPMQSKHGLKISRKWALH